MIPGPVFVAELRRTSRRARYFAARAALGALLLAVAWVTFRSVPRPDDLSPARVARLARDLSSALLLAQAIAVAAIVPALVAGTIAEERSRGTLRDMLASDLTSGEIVLGTLAARMLQVFVFLAVGLPIASVLTLLGGVDPAEQAIRFAATAGVAVLLGGISILASVAARGPREAIFAAYGLSAFWICLAPMLDGPVRVTFPRLFLGLAPIAGALRAANPLMAVERGPVETLIMGGISATLGAASALLAVALLRPASRRIGDGPRASKARRWARLRLFPRRPVGDSPMLWKETQLRRRSTTIGKVTRGAVALLAVGAALGFLRDAWPAAEEVYRFGYGSHTGRIGRPADAAREFFNVEVRVLGAVLYLLTLLGVTASGASAITTEREADTWVSLLASPLEPEEFLRAKRAGVARRTRPLVRATLAIWAVGLLCGAVHPIGFALVCLALFAYRAAATALGVSVSLWSRSTARALGISIAATVFLHGGYLLICVPLTDGEPIATAACSPLMIFLAPGSYRDVSEFFHPHKRDGYYHRGGEILLAGLLSLLAYAALAAVLNIVAAIRFDATEDRPAARRDAPTPHDDAPEGETP